MRSAFQTQREKLRTIAHRHNRPILFTEIGYPATEAAGMASQESRFRKYDEKMQALSYRIALETYWNEPWFAGMYWWKWFSDPSDRGKDADLHSPHGRPAEIILKQWYLEEAPHEKNESH